HRPRLTTARLDATPGASRLTCRLACARLAVRRRPRPAGTTERRRTTRERRGRLIRLASAVCVPRSRRATPRRTRRLRGHRGPRRGQQHQLRSLNCGAASTAGAMPAMPKLATRAVAMVAMVTLMERFIVLLLQG